MSILYVRHHRNVRGVVAGDGAPAASSTHGHEDHGQQEADVSLPLWLGLRISIGVLLVALIWSIPGLREVSLPGLLEQARPAGTLPTESSELIAGVWPNEHDSHVAAIKVPATMIAFGTALSGFLLATVFYCWKWLDPADVRQKFSGVYRFLWNKWWFDELYEVVFIQPTHWLSRMIANIDRLCIDWLLDHTAWLVRTFAVVAEKIADQSIVDGFVNKLADFTYNTGLQLRGVQTGRLRQYVMFIGVGTVAAFVLATFVWGAGLGR